MPLVALIVLVGIAAVAVIILWLSAYEKRECDRDTAEHAIIEKLKTCPLCHLLLDDCVCGK